MFLKQLRKLLVPFSGEPVFSLLALLTLAVPLAFGIFTYEKFETVKLALWLMLLGAACAVFFRLSAGRKVHIQVPSAWPLLALVLFLAWAVLASFISQNRLTSLVGAYPRFTDSLVFFAVFCGFAALLFFYSSRRNNSYLIEILIFDALLIAVVGILQSVGVAFYSGPEVSGFLRGPSLLGNPNFSNMFLAAVAPLALPLLVYAGNRWLRLYYAAVVVLSLWALVALSSRGALLAAIFGLAASVGLSLFARKYRLSAAAASALLLLLVLWYGFLPVTRQAAYTATVNLSEANVNLRFYVWDIAGAGIIAHPWFGTGLGNFQLLFERQRGSNLASQNGVYDDAHNLFLQLAATGGLPLVLFFCSLLLLAAFAAWRKLSGADQAQAVSLLAALSAWCVAAAFTPVPTACYLLLAVILSVCVFAENPPKIFQTGRAFGLGLSAAGIALAVCGLLFLAAESLFYAGYQEYYNSNFALSFRLVNAAAHIYPANSYYYIYRAANLAQLHRENLAEADIGRFINLSPTDARGLVSAANVYYTLYLATGRASYLSKAASEMDSALVLDKFFADHYGVAGIMRYLNGQPRQAFSLTAVSLSLDPAYVPSWLLLARLYQLQGKREQVVYALSRAFRLRPDLQALEFLQNRAKQPGGALSINIPVGYLPTPLE